MKKRDLRREFIYGFFSAFRLSVNQTKVITTANQINIVRSQSELKVSTCNRREARENGSDQVKIGFSFASDWLRGWREFSKPITERSTAKPIQSRNTFDTQLKIAVCGRCWSAEVRPY